MPIKLLAAWLATSLLLACVANLGLALAGAASHSAESTGSTTGRKIPQSHKDYSLRAIARRIDSAAAKAYPGGRAFVYSVYLYPKPLVAGATSLPAFSVGASYESPSDNFYYEDARYEPTVTGAGSGIRFQRGAFRPPDGCFGNPPGAYPPPAAEPSADHLPLREWSIDFPDVLLEVKKNAALFSNGVQSLTVTTARRLRVIDGLPKGCSRMVYNANIDYRRLAGVDHARAVMEIREAPTTISRGSANYCQAGHYMIIDAQSYATIERGHYQHCFFSVP